MKEIIKGKVLLHIIATIVMVASACLISCGSDAVLNPATNLDGSDTNNNTNTTSSVTNELNDNIPILKVSEASGTSIGKWLNKQKNNQNLKKYTATIKLNGKNTTYSIVYRDNAIYIFDNYDGKEYLNSWGYASGHKLNFMINDIFIRILGDDTIIVDKYAMRARLPKDDNIEHSHGYGSHYYDENPKNNRRKEEFYNVALPKYIKLTSEGLLMTYYTYNSKTGAIKDNQTALFRF